MAETRKKKFTVTEEPESGASDSLVLIHGDDDYLVTEEARRIIATWTPQGASEFGLETIDGMAGNAGEAAAVFGRLFESLQSQSFFATEKVVWWRNTNLLGAGQTASAAGTGEFLTALGEIFDAGLSKGTRLVITASELDGRKSIAKLIQKKGRVVAFKADPYKQEANHAQALMFANETARKLEKKLEKDAAVLVVEMSGNDSRTILSELEKIAVYIGDRDFISEKDVHEIGSWRPGGVVWDLSDAVGERNVRKALDTLQNLLFIGESPVPMLFAVISRVRLLLMLSILMEKKVLRLVGDYNSFKLQIEGLPSWVTENLPEDKKLNPLAGHPFALFKASGGAGRYTRAELQKAMEILLECNERMVSGGGDHRHLIEEALLKICMK